jgi:transposase
MSENTHGSLTRAEMEARRAAAYHMLAANEVTQAEVARSFGVTRTTVCRWAREVAAGESPERHYTPGRPPLLDWRGRAAEIRELCEERSRWTSGTFAKMIEERFGVSYNHDHAHRIMRELGIPRIHQWRPADQRRRRRRTTMVSGGGAAS